VITFKIDFKPSGFDRPVTDYFQSDIQSRLLRAGIGTLTVNIIRGPRHQLLLQFEGGADDIAKANTALASMVGGEEAGPTSHRTLET
jgi:hypothetical protein